MSISDLYRIKKDHIRENFSKYIENAYNSIPKIDRPVILDIGCGTGVPTILLAKLSDGTITGIDIDDVSLDMLRTKIKKFGLENRISIIKDSIVTHKFQKNYFDIIWAEGSLFISGFEKSLIDWYPLIKNNGYLVAHDARTDMKSKLDLIPRLKYSLINHFELSEVQWLEKYFYPLEKLINEFRKKSPDDPELKLLINKDQSDIKIFKSDSTSQSSFYAVMQKIS